MFVPELTPNLARRLAQLDHIPGPGDLSNIKVWLGGLFYPKAYVERVNDPEALIIDGEAFAIYFSIPCHADLKCTCFSGLVLEGASWATEKLELGQDDRCGSTLRKPDGCSRTRLPRDRSISRSTWAMIGVTSCSVWILLSKAASDTDSGWAKL